MMHGLSAWPPTWLPDASGLQQPMHISLASKPRPATVCAAGAGWAVLVGYMRVSTAEQNPALQHDALLAAGVASERIYGDTCSGAVTSRPGLARALDVAREGDALVIWKLDRIGRSLRHFVELVDGLQRRGVGLKVLTGGIDTTSATGRLVFGIFATLAEFERDLILERTMAGLAAARARHQPRPAAADDARQAEDGDGDDGRPQQCRHRRGRAAWRLAQHALSLRGRRGASAASCASATARARRTSLVPWAWW